jgi:V/A-type H+-transporting ATPase subunit F
MPKQIAAIGDADSMMGFAALGIHCEAIGDAQEAEEIIFKLAREGVAVIFVDENLAQRIPQTLARYSAQPYPAIIPIPGNRGSTGFGLKQLKANVEKALGADILFGKES